jgi:uncharacterized protein (TIGR02246 family)
MWRDHMKLLDPRRESTPWIIAGVLLAVIAYQQFSRVLVDPLDAITLLRFVREFEAAAQGKDPDRLIALFHTDAEHFGLTTGRLVRGRDNLHELFQDEFSGEAGADRIDTEVVAFRFLTPEVLVADLTANYTNYRLGDRFWPVFREHTTVVLIHRDGSWRIAATSAGGHDASQ